MLRNYKCFLQNFPPLLGFGVHCAYCRHRQPAANLYVIADKTGQQTDIVFHRGLGPHHFSCIKFKLVNFFARDMVIFLTSITIQIS
jgi:hypothetical protein